MLLKTKIMVVFLISFIIMGFILLGQNLRARSIIEKTAVLEIGSAHKIIWDKILLSAHRELQLYAFRGEPGSGSIWALRGSRSPIAAIETRKPKLVDRAMGKYFQALKDEGTLDHILIFDGEGSLVYHFGDQNKDTRYEILLDGDGGLDEFTLASINSKIALQLAFPIFTNGRSVGTVIYAKEIESLAKQFEIDTGAQITSPSKEHLTYLLARPIIEIPSQKSSFAIFSSKPAFSITSHTYPLGTTRIELNITTDISDTINANNTSFVLSLAAIAFFLLTISAIVFIILTRGFKPLNVAIRALDALAHGDTSVVIEQNNNDEVGQISKAVQALRLTAIEFEEIKLKSKISAKKQRDNIYRASENMTSVLPKEIGLKIRNDISTTRELSNQSSPSMGLFTASEDNSLMLVEKIFSRLSKEISDQFQKQINLTKSYQRFVPKELLLNLKKLKVTDVVLGDQIKKNVSVLFSDIRSFTTISEQLSAEQTFNLLNNYLGSVLPAITSNNGYIDKFIGDAIMAIFTDHPAHSVLSGVDMLKALEDFNANKLEKHEKPLKIGIGINSGPVTIGTLGISGRLEGTVIGDSVNVAARLEALTKLYGCPLLIGETTFNSLEGYLDNSLSNTCRKIDFTEVKGKSQKIAIYEVFAWENAEIIEAKIRSKDQFENAVFALSEGDVAKAKTMFNTYCKQYPNDKVAEQLCGLCQIKLA